MVDQPFRGVLDGVDGRPRGATAGSITR
jgi:hypothetical protein